MKVKVIVTNGSGLKRIFPWKNTAALARLKGSLIMEVKNKDVSIHDFTAKWDTRPEPWDYNSTPPKPKLELIPFALEPENLLPGDVVEASVVVKHPEEEHFYIFDPNYYLPWARENNIIKHNLIRLRLIFTSSSVVTKKEFVIINEDKTTKKFTMKELS